MKLGTFALVAAAALAIFTPRGAFADQTIAYPTVEESLFTIVSPEDWELTPAEEKDDYFVLEGPTGATLYLRAMPGKIEETIDENLEYLEENYKDINIGEPSESSEGGFASLAASGTGKSKEDDTEVSFGMAWIAFPTGQVAEIWFETTADDKEGAAAAQKILQSFTPAK